MGILSTSVASPTRPYCPDDLANDDMCCRDPVDIYKRSSGGVFTPRFYMYHALYGFWLGNFGFGFLFKF